jgi:hypothetical protein
VTASRRRLWLTLAFLAAAAGRVGAQDALVSAAPATSSRPSAGDIGQFLVGGALGLGLHESGHVLTSLAFGADPDIKRVSFGFIPFFAITHDRDSPAREYTISSAGFWMQSISSEWLLTRRPRLSDEHAPLAKGVLAFDVLASVAYGFAGMAHVGPAERDTRSMAASLDVNEAWVGAIVVTPAVFDTWRYLRPDARWPRWASRAAKVGMVLLVVRAAR